jgi:DNA polymerase
MTTTKPLDQTLADGRILRLTPAGKPGVFVCEILLNGAAVWSDQPVDLNKETHRKKIQAQGVPPDLLMGLRAEAAKVRTAPATSMAPAAISYRGMKSPASTARQVESATPLDALDTLLAMDPAALPDEAFIFWDESLELRAVDVDWHGGCPTPAPSAVERFMLSARPTPCRYWLTHGGGARLVYVASGGYSADDLAACAAAHLLELAPGCTVEIKCDTRHPASLRDGKAAGKVCKALADTHLGVINRFAARGCSDGDRDKWLEDQGLELGQVYAHHACPIDASHVSQHETPVFVGEKGLYCASCASRLGDGFRNYGRLTGASPVEKANPIFDAARTFVHWEQAAYYFQALAGDIPVRLHRPIYSSLLRYLHADEPAPGRVERCFAPFPWVRGDGHWLNSDTLKPRSPSLKEHNLNGLPWCLRWEAGEDGRSLKPDASRVAQLEGNGTCPGLLPVAPVRGVPVYGVHNALGQSRERVLVTPTETHRQARYVPRRDRLPLKDAEAFLANTFPGINLDYLKLCHIARGCAEYGDGLLPIIYAHGPSGAAKTTTGLVEATMAGDPADDIGTIRMDGIGEAIGKAASTSGHIFINEFSKLNAASRGLGVNAVLQLGRRHTFRQPYVGVISVENRCYVLLTDKDLPYELRSNEQFGRRVVYVPLRTPVPDWLKGGVTAQAWLEAEGAQKAADSLHSWIVDEYFPRGAIPHFPTLAAKVGFTTLDAYFLASEEGEQRSNLARSLFREVLLCPIPTYSDAWGRGWVAVELGLETKMTDLVRQLCSLRAEEPTLESLAESLEPVAGRWHTLLDLRCPARLEIKKHGNKSFIRFRSDDSTRQGYLTNAELLKTPATPADSGRTPAASEVSTTTKDSTNNDKLRQISTGTTFLEEKNILKTVDSGKMVTPENLPEFTESAQVMHLDFETRSRADLKRTGAWRYSADPSTGVMCLVARLGTTWLEKVWLGEGPYEMPAEIAAALPNLTVAAHNVSFEQAIWKNVLKWPEPGRGWFCTMALAATKGLPLGLDNVAAVLGLPGKEDAGYKIMLHSCKPDRRGEFPHLTAEEAAKLVSYCRHDLELEISLAETHGHQLPGFEPAVFAAHTAVNARGIMVDRDLCAASLRMVAALAGEAGERAEAATNGTIKVSDLTRVKFLKDWLAERKYPVKKLDDPTCSRLLRKDDLPADVRAVLEARAKVSRSSVSKMAAMIDAACEDGRVRGGFMYHGAIHGRWTGKLFQPQNMPRCPEGVDPQRAVDAILSGDIEAVRAVGNGDVEEALVAAIRPAIIAAPGKSLVIVDLSAIEARGVSWLSSDETHLEQFRANDRGVGKDPYCHMADKLFGRPITKADKKERNAGKEPVLGGGYGLGGARMDERCKDKGIDLPALGLTGQMVVDAYRAEYAATCAKKTGYWAQLEDAAKKCLKTRKETSAGRCSFRLLGNVMQLVLPNERVICLNNPRLEDEEVTWTGGTFTAKVFYFDDLSTGEAKPSKIWGGTFLEYFCSGMCRDLVALAMVECEAQGDLPVILHCHDEIVLEVEDAKAEAALARLIAIMTKVWPWCAGFPIAAEGHIAKRYLK